MTQLNGNLEGNEFKGVVSYNYRDNTIHIYDSEGELWTSVKVLSNAKGSPIDLEVDGVRTGLDKKMPLTDGYNVDGNSMMYGTAADSEAFKDMI